MFEPAFYSRAFAALLAEERLNALGPGSPNRAVQPLLESLRVETAFAPAPLRDPAMARCCLAGIWLYHDFLEECHHLCQEIPTPSGSYWHGILHRREPDSSNSKYWFRRLGRHPVFPEVAEAARELARDAPPLPETEFLSTQRDWDPFAFVDLCEAARLGHVPAEPLCRRIQLAEWRILFDYCYRQAIAG
jgi:hypothetical protein